MTLKEEVRDAILMMQKAKKNSIKEETGWTAMEEGILVLLKVAHQKWT